MERRRWRRGGGEKEGRTNSPQATTQPDSEKVCARVTVCVCMRERERKIDRDKNVVYAAACVWISVQAETGTEQVKPPL